MLLPSTAGASAWVDASFPTPPQIFSLGVLGDDGPDRIDIAGDPGGDDPTFELTADTGLTSRSPCAPEAGVSVSCPRFGPKATVSLGKGDDVVVIAAPMIANLQGGEGDDRLIGGPGRDNAGGAEGDDVVRGSGGKDSLGGSDGLDLLSGGAGPDGLLGGKKPDVMLGGPGDDYLNAKDQRRDQLIDCGAGSDTALIDRRLDPEPIGCEVVLFQPKR
jgi:Ca2+-binding RTX toxin-like protein